MKKIITLICIILTKLSFGQYQQYEQYLTPFLSAPIESGFFYFTTPNNIQAGQLYNWYKINAPDPDNDMWLIDDHIDSLVKYRHFKYQQAYKNIPVEGAGCIEHYDKNGSLVFINAKIADSINQSATPKFSQDDAVVKVVRYIGKKNEKVVFAWQNEDWEKQIQEDLNNEYATWYPSAELIWAVDTLKDMHLVIPGSRYTLAYKVSITTIEPENETSIYYIDANTGDILKVRSTHIDVSGDVYGYGNRNLDTKWRGGFIQKYELDAEDNTHNIHTKKWVSPTASWNSMPDTRSSATNWGSTYLTETSTHFHVTNTWDYFRYTFGRTGMDGAGSEVRVKSQYNQINAYYTASVSPNELVFGKSPTAYDLGMEPSIVGHEFTHGITRYTANLAYEYESGALNESFSDIFGIVIQAQTLDGGSTDWIIGNHFPNTADFTRSMSNPTTRGSHWTGQYSGSNPVYDLGQPDYYQGNYWCNCPYNVDKGGVHINSGVQNKWFYILSNGNQYTQAIGMNKAAQISYYALTSLLMGSSQYSDSKEATITAAKILFGECSNEHKSTVNAWNSVGIYASYNCAPVSVDEIINVNTVLVYPNPANSYLTIELPQVVESPVQIFDINGKLVQEIESNELYFQTDVSLLQNGVYLLHFNFNGQQVVKRIIIQN